MPTPSLDAAIVGAGPNGLSAGIVLAQAGHHVRIYEAADTIGGGARSAELTLPGFVHDACSAIHPLAVTSPFFRSLPLESLGLEWIHPPLALAHPLADRPAAVLARSFDITGESFDHPRDADRYRRRFAPLAEHWDALSRDMLGPAWRLPRHPVLLARFGAMALQSAQGAAERWFQGEAARALWAGLAAHAMLPLDRAGTSAFALVLALAGHAVGWPLPRGGSQRLSDALANHLRTLGGEIVTGERITRLDQLPPARVCLFDLTPRQLVAIAGDELPPRYVRALNRFRYGPGVFKIDWALDGPIPWRDPACSQAGTVHLGGTLSEIAAAEAMVGRGEHPERPYVLVAQQSLFDATRAPTGKHTGWAYCHVPAGSTLDMTDRIEAQVERFAPGFGDRVLARHTRNAQQMYDYNANYIGGDINAGAATLRQLLARPVLKANPYATPNPRLFLCSASTPPGGGVHGLCGYHAGLAALRRLR